MYFDGGKSFPSLCPHQADKCQIGQLFKLEFATSKMFLAKTKGLQKYGFPFYEQVFAGIKD
jgi:hypothetical protein